MEEGRGKRTLRSRGTALGVYYCPVKPAQEWIHTPCKYVLDRARVERDLELIADLGVGWIRTPIRWIYLQSREGEIDFSWGNSFYDWYFEKISAFGLRTMVILGDDIPSNLGRYPTEHFHTFVSKVLARYRRFVQIAQIANELGIGNKQPFRWPWPRALEFVRAGIEAVREVENDLTVVVNTLVDVPLVWKKWIDYLDEGGLDYDYVGLDHYPGSWSPGGAMNWKKVITKAGKHFQKPAMITETGYSTYLPEWTGMHCQSTQARFIYNLFRLLKSQPALDFVFWFCFRDYDFSHHMYPIEEHFGLVDRRSRPKTGYWALRKTAESLRLQAASTS